MTKRSPVTLCGALFALALAACGPGAERQGAASLAPLVEAVEARHGALPIEEVVPGRVRARNQVPIRSEIEGRVVDVLLRSGEAVERGQALVRLDASELRERLRQAEAEVALAEAAAKAARARVAALEARVVRSRVLAADELVSAEELETLEAELDALQASAAEAEARVEQARATAEERRSALAKTVVRSPVDGRLGERRVEEGMLVSPSDVLFVAGDLGQLLVEVNLPEEMLSAVEEGQPVVLEPPGEGEPVRANLSRISPFLSQRSFTTVGEIDLAADTAGLRPGMFVDVRILVGESERAVLVPVAALWEDPATGRRGLFVVVEADGLETPEGVNRDSPERARRVAFRRVEVLAEGRGAAGVTGVDRGVWVVTVGQHLLSAEIQADAADAEGSEAPTARVRPITWERVMELQDLQDEDLLEEFLEKQRRIAEALGAEIPASEDVVDEVLEKSNDGTPESR